MSFYTDNILKSAKSHTTQAVNDLDLLEQVTRRLVQSIIDDAKAHGIDLMVFETYRSRERQQMLFDQKATQLRTVGVHHYGLACDIVKSIDGQPSWKGDFSLLGQLAHAKNLIWGGDWGNPHIKHSFVDVYHVQRCSIKRQASLFKGEWYPDENYNPYKDTEIDLNA
jgi:hypothetical protein